MGHAILQQRVDLSCNVKNINIIYKQYWKNVLFQSEWDMEDFFVQIINF